jgi:hypothetical protein
MASITINGTTVSGTNIVIRNGTVLVDGISIEVGTQKIINIEVNGNLTTVDCDTCQSLTVTGDVGSVRTVSGDVDCNDVKQNVETVSGDVKARNITGSVKTVSGDISGK